jgi:hypothetical protein
MAPALLVSPALCRQIDAKQRKQRNEERAEVSSVSRILFQSQSKAYSCKQCMYKPGHAEGA